MQISQLAHGAHHIHFPTHPSFWAHPLPRVMGLAPMIHDSPPAHQPISPPGPPSFASTRELGRLHTIAISAIMFPQTPWQADHFRTPRFHYIQLRERARATGRYAAQLRVLFLFMAVDGPRGHDPSKEGPVSGNGMNTPRKGKMGRTRRDANIKLNFCADPGATAVST